MKLWFQYWTDGGIARPPFCNWCLFSENPYTIGTTEPQWDFTEGVEELMAALREELT